VPNKGTGEPIPGSQTICEWLNLQSTSKDKKILPPADTPERISALALQQIGDGLLDAALLARYERLVRPAEVRVWENIPPPPPPGHLSDGMGDGSVRPCGKQFKWEAWLEAQVGKVKRAIEVFEAKAADGSLAGGPKSKVPKPDVLPLGEITVATALGCVLAPPPVTVSSI
jgi:hypothetical protein